jgi:hypothetical protein
VVNVTDTPAWNRSGPRATRFVAIRAARNGSIARLTANSKAISTPSGTPGMVITSTSDRQAKSAVIITVRRGYRSAVQDSSSPPAAIAPVVAANTTAASSGL